jgi:CRISPR-associated endoribonuclease Cas6
MPSQWTIRLEGPAAPDIPAEAPHAVVSRWLDEDHAAPVKPYSITPPESRGRRTTLQVRLLDDALSGPLTVHTEPGTVVRLGRHRFTVTTPPALEHGCSWAQLSATPPRRAWEVAYVSPVTFRRRNRTCPWPAPDSVLTSLSARWQALDAATAPTITHQVLRSVWVSDIEGRSRPFTLKDTIVSGFVGRLRYACDGTDDEAATVSALFAFARYAGIGSHTAFGLGAARVALERRPHSTHPDHDAAAVIDLDQPFAVPVHPAGLPPNRTG